MYTLSHIRTFVQVVELNNFSRAAQKLNLTVAAVSKHVSQLENALKVQLLERTTRKLLLTEVGHQYYLQCKNIIRAIEAADAIISQTQDEPTGLLRVHSEQYFAEHYLVPKLASFQARYPKVRVNLHIAEGAPNLMDDNIDLVFGKTIQQTNSVIEKTIAQTRFTLCASPNYLKEHGEPKSPKELVKHQYLSHSMRLPTDLLEFETGEQIFIEPKLLINDSYSLLDCAKNDMGFVKLQHYVVAEAIRKGELVKILTNYTHPPITLKVFYQPEKFLQNKVRAFVEHVCEDLPETI